MQHRSKTRPPLKSSTFSRTPLIGTVRQSDIDALRSMFAGLGVVSRIINIPLNAAEKAAQTKARPATPEEPEQGEA